MRCCVPTRCTGQRPNQSDSARHEYALMLTSVLSKQAMPASCTAAKQTAQSIRSLFSIQDKSRSHANAKCTHKAHTHRPQIFHSSPCGQTHLRGNVAESDSEQFLMARPSHYAVLRHACVCVRYVQVRVTTYYEGPAARLLDGVESDRRAGDVGDRLTVWLGFADVQSLPCRFSKGLSHETKPQFPCL